MKIVVEMVGTMLNVTTKAEFFISQKEVEKFQFKDFTTVKLLLIVKLLKIWSVKAATSHYLITITTSHWLGRNFIIVKLKIKNVNFFIFRNSSRLKVPIEKRSTFLWTSGNFHRKVEILIVRSLIISMYSLPFKWTNFRMYN